MSTARSSAVLGVVGAVATVVLLAGVGPAPAAEALVRPATVSAVAAAGSSPPAQATLPPAPADAMGTPAMSTVVEQDNLVVVEPNGSTLKTSRYTLGSDMTSSSATVVAQGVASRTNINPQFPTRSGRFLTDGSRSLQLHMSDLGAGHGLLQLDSSDLTAGGSTSAPVSSSSAGQTVTLVTPIGPITANTGPTYASPVFLSQATSWPRPNVSWTLVESASHPGWFSLVDRADGFCLDVSNSGTTAGSRLDTFPCSGHTNQLWRQTSLDHWTGLGSNLLIGQCADDAQAICLAPTASLSTVRITDSGSDPIPTWSDNGTVFDYNAASAIDMAVGDLDRVVDPQGRYHDEVAIATAGTNGQLRVRVVDYNANGSHVLVTETPTSQGLPNLGAQPGSVNVGVGDFDGDGRNEVAVTFQDPATSQFRVAFFRYAVTATGGRTLTFVSSPAGPIFPGQPAVDRITGNASLAVGQFDTRPKDDIALAYLRSSRNPVLGVLTFNTDLSPQFPAVGDIDSTLGMGSTNGSYTTRGLQLRAGLFNYQTADGDVGTGSSPAGWGMGRRELAVAYTPDYVNVPKGCEPCAVNVKVRQFEVLTASDTTSSMGSGISVAALSDPITLADSYSSAITPIGFDAGGFATQGTVDGAVQWGIAVTSSVIGPSQLPYHVVQTLVPNGKDQNRRTLAAHQITATDATILFPVPLTPVAVDFDDRTLRLGAPVAVDVPSMEFVKSVVAAPPTHADWIPGSKGAADGAFQNISRTGTFTVAVGSGTSHSFTATTETTAGHSWGWSVGVTASQTFKGGVPLAAASAKISESASLDRNWGESTTTVHNNTASVSTNITATGVDDDLLVIDYVSFRLYRYPVLGVKSTTSQCGDNGASVAVPCHPYFEVTVPTAMRTENTGGKSVDAYQPTWQNGNVLSYPVLDGSGGLPDTDPGSFVKDWTPGGTSAPTTGYLSTVNYGVGGLSNIVNVKIGTGSEATITNHSSVTWKAAASLSVGIKFTGGTNYDGLNTDTNVSAGGTFQHDATTSNGTSSTDTTESSLVITTDTSNPNAGYQIDTAVYYNLAGAMTAKHGVDLSQVGVSNAYWASTYRRPDLAWNVPAAMDAVAGTRVGDYFTIGWDPFPYRQRIRGFTTTTSSGDLFVNPPVAGRDPVEFQVPLHNYSVTSTAGASSVDFYAVKLLNADGTPSSSDVTGIPDYADRIHIGSVGTAPIAPESFQTVVSPVWKPPLDAPGQSTTYRIFAIADPSNSLDETHPLGGDGTQQCPPSSVDTTAVGSGVLDPTGHLIDPMTGTTEKLTCGQNNQGYGLLTVSTPSAGPTAGTSTSPVASGAQIDTGLLGGPQRNTQTPVHLLQNHIYTGALLVHAASGTRERQSVIVYDGDPSRGNVIADTALPAANGGENPVPYSWRPTRLGQHDLYLVLVGTDGRSTSTQRQTVFVDAPSTPTPSPTTTTPGGVPSGTPSPSSSTTGPAATAPLVPASPSSRPPNAADEVAGSASGRLPFTGAGGVALLVALGGALIGAGTLLLLPAWRRHRRLRRVT